MLRVAAIDNRQSSIVNADDVRFMRMALREAERGAREGEVPVGAVVIRERQMLARAHNRPIHLHDPSAHAEVLALRRAGRKLRNYRLEGCDLYVTIEPCAMCVGAAVHARVRCIVFGTRDPKAGACGSALRVLNHRALNHRVELKSGVLAAECAQLIKEFFRKRRVEEKAASREASGAKGKRPKPQTLSREITSVLHT